MNTEWKEAFINLRNYALNGPDLSSLPVGFVPQVSGSTTLVKQGGSWTTGALSITNPGGFKIMYSVNIPDGVTVLAEPLKEMKICSAAGRTPATTSTAAIPSILSPTMPKLQRDSL